MLLHQSAVSSLQSKLATGYENNEYKRVIYGLFESQCFVEVTIVALPESCLQ